LRIQRPFSILASHNGRREFPPPELGVFAMSKPLRLRVLVQCVATSLLLVSPVAPQAGIFDGITGMFKDNNQCSASRVPRLISSL
jgi:hypothetical protein